MELSLSENLSSLLSKFFPKSEVTDISFENSFIESEEKYLCILTLCGHRFRSTEYCHSKQEALNSASALCFRAMQEFLRILTDTSDAFDTKSLADAIIKKFSLKIDGIKAENKSKEKSVDDDESGDYVSLLYEYARGVMPDPNFSYIEEHGQFRGKVEFLGQVFVCEKLHRTKNKAKNGVAMIAYKELIEKSSLTLHAIRVEESSKVLSLPESLSQTSFENFHHSAVVASAEPFKAEPLPAGKKYLSIVNEYCQKNKIQAPEYDFILSNNISSIYVCQSKFENSVFTSSQFNRKGDAKEDVAARIYHHISIKPQETLPKNLNDLQRRSESTDINFNQRFSRRDYNTAPMTNRREYYEPHGTKDPRLTNPYYRSSYNRYKYDGGPRY